MKWFGFGLFVVYAALWIASKDPLGALVALITYALLAALPIAVGAYVCLNAPGWWRGLRGETSEAYHERLEKAGKAAREHHETCRALTFEDYGTSCLVYVIEVGEGRLLCLHGQDYYSFEPCDDDEDPEMNQPRKFPTSIFSLLRDKKKGKVLALYPGSVVVEPVVCNPIKSPRALHGLGIKLEDGEIVVGVTLDAVESAVRSSDASRRS
jgi:hypothetical protein